MDIADNSRLSLSIPAALRQLSGDVPVFAAIGLSRVAGITARGASAASAAPLPALVLRRVHPRVAEEVGHLPALPTGVMTREWPLTLSEVGEASP